MGRKREYRGYKEERKIREVEKKRAVNKKIIKERRIGLDSLQCLWFITAVIALGALRKEGNCHNSVLSLFLRDSKGLLNFLQWDLHNK